MLNLYVVSGAQSFLRHAVHMLSLCDYYDLCDGDGGGTWRGGGGKLGLARPT